MNLRSIYRFVRPTLFIIICYLFAMLLLSRFPRENASLGKGDPQRVEELATIADSIIHPDPALAPEDVVRLQLQGLSNTEAANGILQCMMLASPANRAANGPLERFGQMVRSEQFRILATADRKLIGRPTFAGDNARVLVTVVDQKKLSSFVWVLTRQFDAPYKDCWMTDAVFPQGDTPVGNPDNEPAADSI